MFPARGRHLVYEHARRCRWKPEKAPCPGVEYLKMILCLRRKFRKQHPVLEFLQTKLCTALKRCKESIRKWKCSYPKDLNHTRSANGVQPRYAVNYKKCGPCHGADSAKMIPCPGVRILKMIPRSAARPRTEHYMSAPHGVPRRSTYQKDLGSYLTEINSRVLKL